jgi:hypothetical protein
MFFNLRRTHKYRETFMHINDYLFMGTLEHFKVRGISPWHNTLVRFFCLGGDLSKYTEK